MVFDINLAMTWILFLALFPMAFFWLRRAWRVAIKHDYSEIALKRGLPPENPQKYAFIVSLVNLLSGMIVVAVIIGVLTAWLSYATWSAAAGVTIWFKIIADFILSRHAHSTVSQRKA